MNPSSRTVLGSLLLASAVISGPCAHAQHKDIGVNAHNDVEGVTVELTLEQRSRSAQRSYRAAPETEQVELKVGDRVRICFKASEAGFVTLWQNRIDSNQSLERKKLYPPDDGSIAVAKDQQLCPLSDGDGWGFEVIGESEDAEVIAYWTTSKETQWGAESYPKVRARSVPEQGYASRTLRYRSTK